MQRGDRIKVYTIMRGIEKSDTQYFPQTEGSKIRDHRFSGRREKVTQGATLSEGGMSMEQAVRGSRHK